MDFFRKTKIIATVGPACESLSVLETLLKEGVDAVRLNFSHGSHASHEKMIAQTRKLSLKLKKPICIIGDLQGPKMRIGTLPKEGILLRDGEGVIIRTDMDLWNGDAIPLPSRAFHEGTKAGNKVFLDDGMLMLEIISRRDAKFFARVVRGGRLFSNKGVNVPMLELRKNLFELKDREDMAFAVRAGVDYIALSFLRTGADVRQAKRMLRGAPIKLIAKIERPEALKNLSEIIEESDAVMVARGDLGIETPLWELPVRQKHIVDECRLRMKPVIVATQMLESMTRTPLPTRAEVSDVANAVYDSADAVMLSAESASGKYPREAIHAMRKILEETEKHLSEPSTSKQEALTTGVAVAHSAKYIAREVGAKFIFAGTVSGFSARAVSHFRPNVPIVAIAGDDKAARTLGIVWGVAPLVVKSAKTVEVLAKSAVSLLKRKKLVQKGDRIVFISGKRIGEVGRTSNLSVIAVS